MADEILVDQSTKLGQTNWNATTSYQGQLIAVPSGEIWKIKTISGYGDGNTWVSGEAYCHFGVCASRTDWNPNNGLQFGNCNYLNLTSSGGKHTFDMTSITGFSDGIYITPEKLYFFYFRHVAEAFAGQCHSSTGYAPLVICEAIDSADSGTNWTKPATWVGGSPNDLRFQLYGEKIEEGATAVSDSGILAMSGF